VVIAVTEGDGLHHRQPQISIFSDLKVKSSILLNLDHIVFSPSFIDVATRELPFFFSPLFSHLPPSISSPLSHIIVSPPFSTSPKPLWMAVTLVFSKFPIFSRLYVLFISYLLSFTHKRSLHLLPSPLFALPVLPFSSSPFSLTTLCSLSFIPFPLFSSHSSPSRPLFFLNVFPFSLRRLGFFFFSPFLYVLYWSILRVCVCIWPCVYVGLSPHNKKRGLSFRILVYC